MAPKHTNTKNRAATEQRHQGTQTRSMVLCRAGALRLRFARNKDYTFSAVELSILEVGGKVRCFVDDKSGLSEPTRERLRVEEMEESNHCVLNRLSSPVFHDTRPFHA